MSVEANNAIALLGFLQALGVVSVRVEAYTLHTSPESCSGNNLILREH